MPTRSRRSTRTARVTAVSRTCAVLVLVGSTGLSGCGAGAAQAPPTSASASTPRGTAAAPAGTKSRASAATTSSAPPTTSTLGPFPAVLSSSPAAFDAASIRSTADLPRVFQCLPQVTPIEIPGSGDTPAMTVCPSKLAGGESIYLWFVDSPDARYRALKAALARNAAVRGGPSWVAAGPRGAALSGLGGDVYK